MLSHLALPPAGVQKDMLTVKGAPSVSENVVDLDMMSRKSMARLKSQDGEQKVKFIGPFISYTSTIFTKWIVTNDQKVH